MALLDNVGKTIGIASQGLSDAVKIVSSSAQEARENIERERQEKAIEKEENLKAEQEKKAEIARKCPKCGQQLNGIIAVCPLCGYEIRSAKTAEGISGLTNEINRLNQKRNTVTDAIASFISGRKDDPTDEKIASLIQNFVVPNTKEEIFEFMILAAGNMDAKFLAGREKATQTADIVIRAWASKFEQTFQKAKFSFGQDTDFEKIESLYNAKMTEIEEAKPFSLFGRKKK